MLLYLSSDTSCNTSRTLDAGELLIHYDQLLLSPSHIRRDQAGTRKDFIFTSPILRKTQPFVACTYTFTETESFTSYLFLSAAGISLYEYATPIATRFPSIRRKGKIDRNLCRSASNYVLHLSANVNLLVIGSFAYTSKSLHNCRSCVEGECAWDSTIFVFMFSIKDSALCPLSLRDFLGGLPGQRSCRASFVFAAVRVS